MAGVMERLRARYCPVQLVMALTGGKYPHGHAAECVHAIQAPGKLRFGEEAVVAEADGAVRVVEAQSE